ncbi:hypothetical protein M8542_10225 [Amycolatopsis sp. OK19-0408]|uniref:GAF domain-containing protein n=1 Tax=Amycolatopsis iheyensis TaxID=2945988 RepID=A0A9X2N937_9PSEU|nr:hypothetical protein [Amycolatopsis iheyensis]MCR6483193.1 hypothetical protein [Amycolatopsis iheyensis]
MLALNWFLAVPSGDVAADPVFDGTATRDLLLGAGMRAALSLPLPAPHEQCEGVLTVLHERPGHQLTGPARDRLDALTRSAGWWLHTHREDRVLAALADLHRRGVAATA